MAVVTNKRIIELDEESEVSDDMYMILDSSNGGTRKMSAGKLVLGNGEVKKIEVVDSLPEDAATHLNTVYLVKGNAVS